LKEITWKHVGEIGQRMEESLWSCEDNCTIRAHRWINGASNWKYGWTESNDEEPEGSVITCSDDSVNFAWRDR
jgi:hypothetical protein